MKLKMKLVEIVDRRKKSGEKWTYIWKPTLDIYKGLVQFTVKDDHKTETTGDLELPITVDDTIILDISVKGKQTDLKAK